MEDDSTPEFCVASGMLVDALVGAGFTQRLTVSNKADAVMKILVHEIITSRKAEIDQLASGLGPIVDLAQRYPDVVRQLLTAKTSSPLTAEDFETFLDFDTTMPVHLKEFFLRYVKSAGMP